MLNVLRRQFRRPKQTKPKLYYEGACQGMAMPDSNVTDTTLALEERILLDAAAIHAGTEAVVDTIAQQQAEQAFVDSSTDAETLVQAVQEKQQLFAALSSVASSDRSEIIFIDRNIDDYQTLIADIDPKAELVFIDSDQDGIERIADVLSLRTDIDAIHILSHGEAGQLQLGNAVLSSESMAGEYTDELSIIKNALSEQADILIYGCNFAEGEIGQLAADKLAVATGADVAASVDLTGNNNQGADWDLEYQRGQVETDLAISQQAQENWDGTLVQVVNLTGPQTGSYTATADGQVTITITGGDGGDEDAATGGQGATVTATFNISAGEEIVFAVGEAGQSNISDEAGGGGSTGVYIGDLINGYRLVMVAGAGGGAEGNADGQGGQSTAAGGDDSGDSFVGGVNGTGGTTGATAGAGGGIGNPSGNANGTGASGGANTGGAGLSDVDASDGLTLALGGTTDADGGDGFTAGGSGSGGEAGGGGGYSGGGAGGTNGATSGGGGGGSFLDTADSAFVSGNIIAGVDGGSTQADGTILVDFDADTDGDGLLDSADIDDDNDGIIDSQELGNTTPVSNTFTVAEDQLGDGPANSNRNIDLSALGINIGDTITITNVLAEGDLNGGTETFTITIGGTTTPALNTGQQYSGTLDPVTPTVNFTTTVIDIGGGTAGINVDANTTAAVDQFGGNPFALRYTFDIDYVTQVAVTDVDGDGIDENVDLDSDNDGISDLVESGFVNANFDTNNDGTISIAEAEAILGVGNADLNGDGLLDVFTAGTGTIPDDFDSDGIDNYLDLDSDNDGIADTVEARPTTGYSTNDGDVTDNDADGDGVIDLFETGGTDDGLFGGAFTTPQNTDGTDNPDYLDTDSDNDSLLDSVESGLTLTGTDSNGDGIDDGVNASYSDPDGDINNPQTDLGNEFGDTSEVAYREALDLDGDGVADVIDIDDDNDGIIDSEEGLLGLVVLTYDAAATAADPSSDIVLTDAVTGITASMSIVGNVTVAGATVTTNSVVGTFLVTISQDITSFSFDDLDNFDQSNFIDAIAIDQLGTWSNLGNANGINALVDYDIDIANGGAAGEAALSADTGGETITFDDMIAAGAISNILVNPNQVQEDNYTATFNFQQTTNSFNIISDDVVKPNNQLTQYTFNTVTIFVV